MDALSGSHNFADPSVSFWGSSRSHSLHFNQDSITLPTNGRTYHWMSKMLYQMELPHFMLPVPIFLKFQLRYMEPPHHE